MTSFFDRKFAVAKRRPNIVIWLWVARSGDMITVRLCEVIASVNNVWVTVDMLASDHQFDM